jgi:hypothetical protein
LGLVGFWADSRKRGYSAISILKGKEATWGAPNSVNAFAKGERVYPRLKKNFKKYLFKFTNKFLRNTCGKPCGKPVENLWKTFRYLTIFFEIFQG